MSSFGARMSISSCMECACLAALRTRTPRSFSVLHAREVGRKGVGFNYLLIFSEKEKIGPP